MWQSWFKFLSVVATVVFIWHFDRFGEKIFVNSLFASIAPIKVDGQSLPTAKVNAIDQFPRNFSFGVSTSAYQIEGGWNEDGKSISTWDTFTHDHPDLIADGTNVDVGSDSYHLFNDDVKAIDHVGVKKIIDNVDCLQQTFLSSSFNTTDSQFLGPEFFQMALQ